MLKQSTSLILSLTAAAAVGAYFLFVPSSVSQRIRHCAVQCSHKQCTASLMVARKCVKLCVGTEETLTMQKLGECRDALRFWRTKKKEVVDQNEQ